MSSSRKQITDGDRDNMQPRHPADRNYSDPISYRQRRDTNNNTLVEDSSEGAVVQRKGRFQVTSADVSQKGQTCLSSGSTAGLMPPYLSASAILPTLQYVLQQTNLQRATSVSLLMQRVMAFHRHCRSLVEGELLAQVMQLLERVGSLVDELQRQKLRNAQLERQLDSFFKKAEKTKD